jgi:hypothetical protein
MIPQWRTTSALAERLQQLGVSVRFDTRLESFTVGDEALHTVSTSSGGDRVEMTSRYLVGCDGGHSLVRRMLGLEFVGTSDETRRCSGCGTSGPVTGRFASPTRPGCRTSGSTSAWSAPTAGARSCSQATPLMCTRPPEVSA